MAAGYELLTPEPSVINLRDIVHYPQVVEIMEFIIINSSGRVPTIEQLVMSEFFRNIDLREMRATSWPLLQAKMTALSSQLLETVRNRNSSKSELIPEDQDVSEISSTDNLQIRKLSMRSKSCDDEKCSHATERKSNFEHCSLSLYHRQQSLDFQFMG
ncbi:slowpoke-binding protein-like isoform X2 [Adelges cooleyi]|uniref:slowpoke-binding protein-like isoform X2 n=1 Tax=Adelges cooleyi TaxID=133065 RepID=UPI00218000E8|nr:slowpoke-binding protein-like isoform X2 [Adelges cooleyi]